MMPRAAPWHRRAAACVWVAVSAHAAGAPLEPPAAAAPATPGRSAAALYNAANADARDNRPGLAILGYERARLLDPTDPDIRANLGYVRQKAKLPAVPVHWYDRVAAWARPPVYWALGLAGLVLAGAGLLAAQRRSRHRWLAALAVAAGAVPVGGMLCSARSLWPLLHEAVVITAATPVRASPVPMGDPLFSLPEGDTVMLRAEHDEYALIETGGGRSGWTPRNDLGAVVAAP